MMSSMTRGNATDGRSSRRTKKAKGRRQPMLPVLRRLATHRSCLRGLWIAAAMLLAGPGHAQVTVNFWDMIWGPPEYIDAAKKLVDRFDQENPKIQVRYRSVPWANWYQTYVTAIGSGTAPDI